AEVFAVRAPDVVHETIDGETVIIDMANGAYYRLEAASARAWLRLLPGATAAGLCGGLGAAVEAASGGMEGGVGAFLDQAIECELVTKSNGVAPSASDALVGARTPFPGLAIHRFTDLQELLFLDPVHEVDESGWPVQAPPR